MRIKFAVYIFGTTLLATFAVGGGNLYRQQASPELQAAKAAIQSAELYLSDDAGIDKDMAALDTATKACQTLETDLPGSRKNLEAYATALAKNVTASSNVAAKASAASGPLKNAQAAMKAASDSIKNKKSTSLDEDNAVKQMADDNDKVSAMLVTLSNDHDNLGQDTQVAVLSIGLYSKKLSQSFDSLTNLPATAPQGQLAATRVSQLFDGLNKYLPAATFSRQQTYGAGKTTPVGTTLKKIAASLQTLQSEYPTFTWQDQVSQSATDTDNVARNIVTFIPNLASWFTEIDSDTKTVANVDDLAVNFRKDPVTGVGPINDKISGLEGRVKDLTTLIAAWPTFDTLEDAAGDGQLAPARYAYKQLGAYPAKLLALNRELIDVREGEMDKWITDQVTLYYFTDVRRIIAALNNGFETQSTETDYQKDYDNLKKAARDAQTDYENSYDAVTNKINHYSTLTVELDAAKHDLSVKQNDLDRANALADRKQKAYTDAQAQTQAAQTAATGSQDPQLQQKLQDAQKKEADAKAASDAAQQAQADALKARDAANQTVEGNSQEAQGLPYEISQAQKDLESASQAMKMARNKLNDAEQDQVDAFAKARDNAPFIFARADAASPDPLKHVTLFAYDDSKTILIRGTREDVDNVKEVISEFDKPAPQARITLWTMQVNTTSSRNGREQLGNALDLVDEELGETRGFISDADTMLRDCLNERVHKVQDAWLQRIPNVGLERERIARCYFYQAEAARSLGFDQDQALHFPLVYYYTRWTLPDPAASTTLGETLMILSLGTEENRCAVMADFSHRLHQYLVEHNAAHHHENWEVESEEILFENLRRELGLDSAGYVKAMKVCGLTPVLCEPDHDDILTPAQTEIVSALKRAALEKFIENAPTLARLISRNPKLFSMSSFAACDQYLAMLQAFPHETLGTVPEHGPDPMQLAKALTGGDEHEVAAYVMPAFGWLKLQFGITPGWLANLCQASEADAALVDATQRDAERQFFINLRVRRQYPSQSANARIAAADEMLKEINIGYEDDLNENFIHPLLVRLRHDIQSNGLDLGVVDRTSLLATNRQIGRVDPSATAQLDLAGQTDLVAAAQQFEAINGVLRTGSFQKTADVLNGLNKEPASELYALTSGAEFKVTPVFDPSGQALRFQFDYLYTTKIRQPDGTVDPVTPQVDRHAVNATVQLSNMELREVSRFENNTALGVPPKYWGGIPILNQIPVIDRIPIIGWFSKRDGRAAVSQASLIFAQTAMYPTIGDISDLLTGSLAIPNFGDNCLPTVETVPLLRDMNAPQIATPAPLSSKGKG